MVVFYRILLGIDSITAPVVVFFFMWGLSDGTVSDFNIGIWLMLLGGGGGVLGGGVYLKSIGHPRPAIGVLLLLAIPATLMFLFFAVLMIAQPRWN
jgi:hypothetical protein